MRITRRQLAQIIREEARRLSEAPNQRGYSSFDSDPFGYKDLEATAPQHR